MLSKTSVAGGRSRESEEFMSDTRTHINPSGGLISAAFDGRLRARPGPSAIGWPLLEACCSRWIAMGEERATIGLIKLVLGLRKLDQLNRRIRHCWKGGSRMRKLIQMTCRACGGKLEILGDTDQFACGHCGTEFMVRRTETTVSLSPVIESISRVEQGVDRVANVLKAQRVHEELQRLELALAVKEGEFAQYNKGCWARFADPEEQQKGMTDRLQDRVEKQKIEAELAQLRPLVEQKREELEELEKAL